MPLLPRLVLLLCLVLSPAWGKPKAEPKPEEVAARALWERANRGEAKAQFELARHLRSRRWHVGLPPQPKKGPSLFDVTARWEAGKFYEKAALQNYPEAGTELGMMIREAELEKNDQAQAEKWFHHDIALGSKNALYQLGLLLYDHNTASRRAEAAEWFKKAGEAGIPAGYRYLGRMHAGMLDVVDYEESGRYFDLATATGDPEAAQWKAKSLADRDEWLQAKAERERKPAAKEKLDREIAERESQGDVLIASLPPALRQAVLDYRVALKAPQPSDKRPTVTVFATQVHEIGGREGVAPDLQLRAIVEAVRPTLEINPLRTYGFFEAIPAELYPQAFERSGLPERFVAGYKVGPKLLQMERAADANAAARAAQASAGAATKAAAPLPTREIGQRFGDGIVVYVDGSGQHGLILALTEIGSGKPQDGGLRPQYVDSVTGLSTWYLPSLEEWKRVYAERRRVEWALSREKATPLGKNGHYWTSTAVIYHTGSRTVVGQNWCYLPTNDNERAQDPYNTLAAVRTVRGF